MLTLARQHRDDFAKHVLVKLVQRVKGLFARQLLLGFALHAALILSLTACADKPPIVSADTSCESYRYVSANDAQVKVFADNWEVMESYADQVISNNIEYTKKCLGVAP